jgi:RNA polymerase sigma-70 factor (ECF subfamily)
VRVANAGVFSERAQAADAAGTTVAAVNSALRRARPTLKAHLSERRLEWGPDNDPSEA